MRLPAWTLLLLLALAPAAVRAQEGIGQKEAERMQARKEKEERKQLARQKREDLRHHLKIQDKATRKRLKRHTRRADRRGSGLHRDSWFRRTFTR
ncbi:MAG: hypothetical protein IT228_10615 [Flavobacteriales bacterium]|nr:hypothetical protein [Flavobacteriales bacterium]MCC6577783.1 hypothetical protein [Flavobacteriales bacterium]NUQ15469.1 hypothetical protein [Flavobacteriales bacterium]